MPRLKSLRSTKRRNLRKKKILRLVFSWILALVSVCSAVLLFLNSHFIRISSISIEGDNTVLNEQVQSIVEKSISGDYFWFIPKDSFFLFPSRTFSRIIPVEFPSVAKISFSHRGLTAVTATINQRSPYAIVCIGQGQDDCYYADLNGLIFQSASSTDGAFIVYHISLPNDENPIGIDFLDSRRLQALGSFVGSLARLGFVDNSITISTSTSYDLALEYSSASSSTPILHLIIDESRPFSETLENFSAFWQEYMSKGTTTSAPKLSMVDMRYGSNIIYKIK
jgi:hypothetical protein